MPLQMFSPFGRHIAVASIVDARRHHSFFLACNAQCHSAPPSATMESATESSPSAVTRAVLRSRLAGTGGAVCIISVARSVGLTVDSGNLATTVGVMDVGTAHNGYLNCV